jgi:plastocyanin
MNCVQMAAIWALSMVAFGASICEAASISGHVIVTKVLTKKKVTLPSYQMRSAALPARYVEPNFTGEMDRLAIYLEGSGLKPGAPVRVELDQRGMRFDPEVIIVPVGSEVAFPNSDPIFHNVFSFSKAKEFDLGYYPAGQSRTVKFDRAGVIQVYCHIHSQMSASILVAPNAWHTRPSRSGDFVLSGIPEGAYTLVAWHKSAGFFRREVKLSESSSLNVDFEIPIRDQE